MSYVGGPGRQDGLRNTGGSAAGSDRRPVSAPSGGSTRGLTIAAIVLGVTATMLGVAIIAQLRSESSARQDATTTIAAADAGDTEAGSITPAPPLPADSIGSPTTAAAPTPPAATAIPATTGTVGSGSATVPASPEFTIPQARPGSTQPAPATSAAPVPTTSGSQQEIRDVTAVVQSFADSARAGDVDGMNATLCPNFRGRRFEQSSETSAVQVIALITRLDGPLVKGRTALEVVRLEYAGAPADTRDLSITLRLQKRHWCVYSLSTERPS